LLASNHASAARHHAPLATARHRSPPATGRKVNNDQLQPRARLRNALHSQRLGASVTFFFMIVYALEPVDPYSISTSEDGQTVSYDDVHKSLPMYRGLCARHYDQTRDSATAPAAG
jgi:hypothetical protein